MVLLDLYCGNIRPINVNQITNNKITPKQQTVTAKFAICLFVLLASLSIRGSIVDIATHTI